MPGRNRKSAVPEWRKGGERSLVLPGVLLAERRELLSARGVEEERLNV
jgi:hypothetical protein